MLTIRYVFMVYDIIMSKYKLKSTRKVTSVKKDATIMGVADCFILFNVFSPLDSLL